MLVRAKLPSLANKEGGSAKCRGKRCKMCKYVKDTDTFSDGQGQNNYDIRGDKMNCSSRNVVYLVTCKTCQKQYVGSTTTKFRRRFANYKCCHKRYISGKAVLQVSFHANFHQADHNDMQDWSYTLIDQASSVKNPFGNIS